ncbi:BA75_03032T0 [Komagataella pastoris]|uniref:BA75_03032T0 n=1 Tax=Komagataella pastoris TaxID=4922 RepID=A0A1B2JAJ3_PICPA|nr:BA75_03032T0 [Komagataella pastoris]
MNRHEIRLPGSLLDQIRSNEESSVKGSEVRDFTNKRKRPQVNRKDKRRQLRQDKKEKHKRKQRSTQANSQKSKEVNTEPALKSSLKAKSDNTEKTKSVKFADFDSDSNVSDGDDLSADSNPLEKLRALKAAKKSSGQSIERVVNLSDLSDDEVSDLGDSSIDEAEEENLVHDNEEEEEDPLAQLAALKGKLKSTKTTKSTERIISLSDLSDDEVSDLDGDDDGDDEDIDQDLGHYEEEEEDMKQKKHKSKSKNETVRILSPHERALIEKEEEEMKYYAKKLGLKADSKLNKNDENDAIGGLLDGLDTIFDDNQEQSSASGSEEQDSDDEEFDSDERRELAEMEEIETSDSEADSDSEEGPRVKENPYVAPVSQSSKYVPPALRRKQTEDSEQVQRITKQVKGPLNKLTEQNMMTIVSQLQLLYNDNPRQVVTEVITDVILKTIMTPGRLLDGFVLIYSGLVSAIYRNRYEFGTHIIQIAITKLEEFFQGTLPVEGKEIVNLISFIGFLYNFNVFGCKLIYDIIRERLVAESNEVKVELLLKLIRCCGSKLRSDDINLLKDILELLNKDFVNSKQSTRAKFLIETMTNLKNNKLKGFDVENTAQMIVRIKKVLPIGKNVEPIQVSFDDILHVEDRGKWWLIGSAWKGTDATSVEGNEKQTEKPVGNFQVNDSSDFTVGTEPNWQELARTQRMNTDVRRAIFISIISAEDYVNAFEKLEKLRLKRQQQKEIPQILLHCVTMEDTYNPYYGFLAKKLCEDHLMRKSFQFTLWDILKDFESHDDKENDSDTGLAFSFHNDEESVNEETQLKRVLNLGRFFGFLFGQSSLALHLLRSVNFLTTLATTTLFLEIMFITFLDQLCLKKDLQKLQQVLQNCNEQPLLLKGLKYFLPEKVQNSQLTKGKKQKERVKWGVERCEEIIDQLLPE